MIIDPNTNPVEASRIIDAGENTPMPPHPRMPSRRHKMNSDVPIMIALVGLGWVLNASINISKVLQFVCNFF
jgi:hypothetical protein